jgi:hypothetical protein
MQNRAYVGSLELNHKDQTLLVIYKLSIFIE